MRFVKATKNKKVKKCKKIKTGSDFMLDHIWRYQRKLLSAGKKLPPSYHKLPNQEFDMRKSEVAKWLLEQPEILSFVMEIMKKSEMIFYDPETGKWQGVDWKGDEE